MRPERDSRRTETSFEQIKTKNNKKAERGWISTCVAVLLRFHWLVDRTNQRDSLKLAE